MGLREHVRRHGELRKPGMSGPARRAQCAWQWQQEMEWPRGIRGPMGLGVMLRPQTFYEGDDDLQENFKQGLTVVGWTGNQCIGGGSHWQPVACVGEDRQVGRYRASVLYSNDLCLLFPPPWLPMQAALSPFGLTSVLFRQPS